MQTPRDFLHILGKSRSIRDREEAFSLLSAIAQAGKTDVRRQRQSIERSPFFQLDVGRSGVRVVGGRSAEELEYALAHMPPYYQAIEDDNLLVIQLLKLCPKASGDLLRYARDGYRVALGSVRELALLFVDAADHDRERLMRLDAQASAYGLNLSALGRLADFVEHGSQDSAIEHSRGLSNLTTVLTLVYDDFVRDREHRQAALGRDLEEKWEI